MADGKAMVHHHILLRIIRPEKEPGHVYLLSCVRVSMGRVAKSHFNVNQKKEMKRLKTNVYTAYRYAMRGACFLEPPNQGGLPSSKKKHKRADLKGGAGPGAGTGLAI